MPLTLGRSWLTSTALEAGWGQVELRQLEEICRQTGLQCIGPQAAMRWQRTLAQGIVKTMLRPKGGQVIRMVLEGAFFNPSVPRAFVHSKPVRAGSSMPVA